VSPPGAVLDEETAAALDAADPLGRWRAEFVAGDPDLVYLDGNSLGRPPKQAIAAVEEALAVWGRDLVLAWDRWFDLGWRVGAELAPLLGADANEVVLADQTSVDLFKAATAALRATSRPDVLTDAENFPSDRYVLAEVARAAGGALRVVPADPDAATVARALDERIGLVALSHVSYRSGALADLATLTRVAHEAGALALWDLSHSVGVVPIDLHDADADLAVGCTYKYLNGGPGAPAFLFVANRLADRLVPPIPGWFGHADPFAFSPEYVPAAGARRFLAGTPPILSLVAARAGIALVAAAGIDAIRDKSVALTERFLATAERRLLPLGFTIATPRAPERRGSHVSLAHPHAHGVSRALRARGVLVDHRAPDLVRYGFSPLVTTHRDVWRAAALTEEVVRSGEHLAHGGPRRGVT